MRLPPGVAHFWPGCCYLTKQENNTSLKETTMKDCISTSILKRAVMVGLVSVCTSFGAQAASSDIQLETNFSSSRPEANTSRAAESSSSMNSISALTTLASGCSSRPLTLNSNQIHPPPLRPTPNELTPAIGARSPPAQSGPQWADKV